ncbi:hypothetical protein CDV55_107141 [Aspergillus turcosus]|uniref:Transcription factor domain-containing protein n=1 Tax=Aspergillus turcosus TaxID=1245748 RepID=A0A229WX82_9EURO|nr:hypothetical protein CDV55_107141 [Aspergillus turcosus]RLL98418.1 hypothetical protein CFD26_107157 [Aspergillus turcosus]
MTDRAIDYFLAAHVFRDCGLVRGHYEYLSMLDEEVRNRKQLSVTLSAVALAAYAYSFRHPCVLEASRHQYGHALRLINAALSSQEEMAHYSTIISILLLATFETITSGNSVPAELTIHQLTATFLDTNDPAWKLFDLEFKVAKFRADVKHNILRGRHLLDVARHIDREFVLLAGNLPVQWHFRTMALDEPSELVLGSSYHVYPDVWVAAIWNKLRTCRLLLHQEICAQLSDILATTPEQYSALDASCYQSSFEVMQNLALQVLATVPQFCGLVSMPSGDLLQTGKDVFRDRSASGIPTVAGLYLLFWPLLTAGRIVKSDVQRKWIVDRSRYIGRITGIQQAFSLADVVERHNFLNRKAIVPGLGDHDGTEGSETKAH